MTRHRRQPNSGVSIAFALATEPTRVASFRAVMTALIHAGCSFGREYAGHLVYSYDALGEHYAPPTLIPAGAIANVAQALEQFRRVEQYYNHSIGLALPGPGGAVPITGRVYDDADTLITSLDMDAAHWQRFAGRNQTPRSAAGALLHIGRTLFTLLPASHLLIGPTMLLRNMPPLLTTTLLRATPIAMIANVHARLWERAVAQALHVEHLPHGAIAVRQWDVSQRVARGPSPHHKGERA